MALPEAVLKNWSKAARSSNHRTAKAASNALETESKRDDQLTELSEKLDHERKLKELEAAQERADASWVQEWVLKAQNANPQLEFEDAVAQAMLALEAVRKH